MQAFPLHQVPSVRTFQRWHSSLGNEELLWEVFDQDMAPTQVAAILASLKAVAVASGGRVTRISARHAETIAMLSEVVPGIPPLEAYHLAGDYLDSPPEYRPNLDLYLAFEAWSSEGYSAFLTFAENNLRCLDGVPLLPGDFESLWRRRGGHIRVREEATDATEE